VKPLFTIHAGEYLVGNYLEKKFKDCEIWVPSKDTGTDILMTNSLNRKKNVGIQVKFSKDFLPEMDASFHENLAACGWWTLNTRKIEQSNAELWILAPYCFAEKNIQFVIIEPKKLLQQLQDIHGVEKTINVYLWITKDGKCFETRKYTKEDQQLVLNKEYSKIEKVRDFTKYLNDWSKISRLLGVE
jgi:hypothetical protein